MNKDDQMKVFTTLRDEFNNRCQQDQTFFHNVCHFNKTMQFTVSDSGDTYHFRIENGRAGDVIEGPATKPDVSMDAPMKKILGILVGQIPPTRIIMEPSVKIRGAPQDLMFINKFLLKETPRIREIIKTLDI